MQIKQLTNSATRQSSYRETRQLVLRLTAQRYQLSDFQTPLVNCAKELQRIFTADAVTIHIKDDSDQTLKLAANCRSHSNVFDMITEYAHSISNRIPFCEYLFNTIEDCLSDDMNAFKKSNPDFSKLKWGHMPVHFISSVLKVANEKVGLLTIIRYGDMEFSEPDRLLIHSISNLMVISIENARLHSKVVPKMYEAVKVSGLGEAYVVASSAAITIASL